jgi:plastocyanin
MTFVHRKWRVLVPGAVLAASALVAGPALANTADVSIVGTSFQPATITIAVGDTVTWTTTQSIGQPHSVTSGKPGDADSGKVFDSGIGLQDNGTSFQFTFNTAGTFAYYCQVHPTQMTGEVVVTAAGASTPPASGAAPSAAAPSAPATTPAVSAAPSAGASPAASEAPAPEVAEPPVPPERKLIGAGILAVTLVVLFGAARVWRRMNPA